MAALVVIIGQNWQLPVSLRFEASEGVGMMSERGLVAEGTHDEPIVALEDFTLPPGAFDNPDAATDEDEAAQQDLVGERGEASDEADDAGDEANAASEPSEESGDEDSSEGADEGTADAPLDEAELARREAEEALRQAEARRRRRQRERLEARQEEARQALAQEQAQNEAAAALQAALEAAENPDASSASESDTSADPSTLPPSQRYPQGTINPVATDLGMWGPEGARIVVVLRNDRIRRSAQREPITRLIESFPDWRTLVGSSELDPFEDIDTLVIASSDPRFINRTFVAAVHHLPPEEVVETLSSGYHDGVDWERERGGLLGRPQLRGGIDPRVFYIPTNNVFLFTRPEYVRDLQRGAPSARGMEEALERYAPQTTEATEDDAGPSRDEESGDALPAPDSESTDPDVAGEEGSEDATTATATETDSAAETGSESAEDGEAALASADNDAAPDEANGEGSALAPPPIPREAPDANTPQEASGERETPRARPRPVRPDREPPLRDNGWLRGITELADYGGVGDEGPAVMVSTGSIASFRLQGYRGPQPQALHASIYADRDPLVRARVLFETDQQAARFVASWRDIIRSNRASLMVTGLYGTLEGATVEQDMNEANITFSIPGSTLRRLSVTVSQMMRTRGAPTPE